MKLLAAASIIFLVTFAAKNTARPEQGPGFQKMEACSSLVNLRETNAEQRSFSLTAAKETIKPLVEMILVSQYLTSQEVKTKESSFLCSQNLKYKPLEKLSP